MAVPWRFEVALAVHLIYARVFGRPHRSAQQDENEG
jgi:hypothetical protein